ncbi:response regulator, partial [Acidobacteriota bacterium]
LGQNSNLYDLIRTSSVLNNFNIFFCEVHEDWLFFVRDNSINVVILDIGGDDAEKLDLLDKLKRFDPLIDVFIIGLQPTSETICELIHRVAADYLTKPFHKEKLLKKLMKILERRTLRRETYVLERWLDEKYVFHGLVAKTLVCCPHSPLSRIYQNIFLVF